PVVGMRGTLCPRTRRKSSLPAVLPGCTTGPRLLPRMSAAWLSRRRPRGAASPLVADDAMGVEDGRDFGVRRAGARISGKNDCQPCNKPRFHFAGAARCVEGTGLRLSNTNFQSE